MTNGDLTDHLRDAGHALTSDLTLLVVLQRLVELAVESTGARYGALGVLGPAGVIVDFITVGLTEEERAAIGDLPSGRGLLGHLVTDPRPLRVDNLQHHPASVGFPPRHPQMRSFLGVPVESRGEVYANLYVTEKRGTPSFTEADEVELVLLAAQAGTAIANARLYEQSQRRGRSLEAVREISASILAVASALDTLELIASRARTLVGADDAAVAAPSAAGGALTIVAASGRHADALMGMTVPIEGSASGHALRTGHPVVLFDARASATTHGPMVTAGEMGPAAFIPLLAGGHATGTLIVSRHGGAARFADDEVAILETFATQASLALEYAQARDERHRLEQIEDRERIAKDLHDGIIQSLFAVGLGLQGTAAMAGDERVASRIGEAVSEIDHAISDLRSYIFGLRPALIARQRLGEALDQLAHEFQMRTGITTVTDLNQSVEDVLGPHSTQIVQMVREALSNVSRHAGATTCRVSMRRVDGDAVIEVDDDGRGFDVADRGIEGMGLPNLRTRAASMGGELRVTSTAGEGTMVQLRVPAP